MIPIFERGFNAQIVYRLVPDSDSRGLKLRLNHGIHCLRSSTQTFPGPSFIKIREDQHTRDSVDELKR